VAYEKSETHLRTSFSLSVSFYQCSIFFKPGARDDKRDYQFGGPQITQIKRAEKNDHDCKVKVKVK
jgi:hypothetical protein